MFASVHAGIQPPPWTRHTPPRTRHTPPDQAHTPGTRYTTPPDQAHTPLDQAHPPPGADTPRTRHTPLPRSRRQHTVNEQPVRIILECILVEKFFIMEMKRQNGGNGHYKHLHTISNNIEVPEEPVPRTKKIAHRVVKFVAGEENRILYESYTIEFFELNSKNL